jgi:hypothetical protein
MTMTVAELIRYLNGFAPAALVFSTEEHANEEIGEMHEDERPDYIILDLIPVWAWTR